MNWQIIRSYFISIRQASQMMFVFPIILCYKNTLLQLKYLSRSQKLYPNRNGLPRWLLSIFITWVILTELVKSGFNQARQKRQYKAKSCHFERAGLRICKQPVWACADVIIQSETKISCMNLLWNILKNTKHERVEIKLQLLGNRHGKL
jgi:hypothetical protein